MEAGIDALHEVLPRWDALFVTELDSCGHQHSCDVQGRFQIHRHYPGEGSRSMAWFVKDSLMPRVREVRWQGRAGSLLIKTCVNGVRSEVLVVGWHGAHAEMLGASLSDVGVWRDVRFLLK